MQAVVFDVGGVLAVICHTWGDALDAAGVLGRASVREEPHQACPAFDPYQAGQLSQDAYLQALAAYLECTVPEAMRVHEHILVGPTLGIERIIDELHARGVITACLSNTNEPHFRAMLSGRFPAIDKLQHKFVSHLLGMEKPHPAIYCHVAETLSLDPESILFFDDNLANVLGALKCGWAAHHVVVDQDPAQQIRQKLTQSSLLQAASFPELL
ncbi:MAG TPA: HAD-IA family hydrolase [Fimbriimonadaceae bacterium]|nr:HAD-IA family hydrolase [Fimbriimonadaceae bacterium]